MLIPPVLRPAFAGALATIKRDFAMLGKGLEGNKRHVRIRRFGGDHRIDPPRSHARRPEGISLLIFPQHMIGHAWLEDIDEQRLHE
jgi:hypothetical protein